ncbi:tRNA (adenosine(37)-N6)-threonylcarbamoyltransferase complex dimerization subunit type 1 TsaB [Pseudoalteromonas sp. MSK9-3]|uniref:tRNA (adenosine(37)-N6)-threonylcarbamoyltransferase complex dimerization subunit type 1 TsaB n=1 Tax=Pseudoalteromonas sp. MSK9-3 TaxID=1897633 RepID=UPI000E6CB2D8|nr:tRNA (adenosine(37)-N6)-threonylcarbamoyltransferase complex dimerization subunit type 1 TsaB [Pseudoalteromonas sp. MSK9-3]RJE72311.1 tRNA (adenosine(37)-N6)-threonylcarbamoyltransferase complex dimerization subunit type 1 TsaB [Pseudoalteromonas sp. MSK9-3]
MTYNLLAIDASTEALSIALNYNGKTFRFFEECPQQHSQKILPQIEAMLNDANCKLQDLDGIAFGKGPGSFTGVRIGVAIAQGLAYSQGLKLVGVSTLQTMAQQAIDEHGVTGVLAGIDARMGEVYVGAYVAGDDGLADSTHEEMVCAPDSLANINVDSAVGTAWVTYPKAASENNLKVLEGSVLPDAFYMLKIADRAFANGETVDACDAQPNYVRDTVTWKKLPGKE